jgi:aryl-alcohol dehydrogenase-like predicted oxidoreductase
MRKIDLVPGISSSVLGFGCAPIMGNVNADTAARAISVALDRGVNHFDIARSYGYGRAESFLGDQLRSARPRVVIASKFGIRANWKASIMRPAKPILRMLRRRRPAPATAETAPPVEGKFNPLMGQLFDRVPLRAKNLRANLEESLTALRTDYLDYLFVHESDHRIERWEELLREADRLKQAGKIRAFGMTCMQHHRHLHADYLHLFDVLQTNVPTEREAYDRLVAGGTGGHVFYSPMQAPLPGLSPPEKLSRLATDLPGSIILCSMFKPRHIIENARVVTAVHSR